MHFCVNMYGRGGEWYLEKRGSRKILTGSRNLGSVFRSLVFAWFVGNSKFTGKRKTVRVSGEFELSGKISVKV